MGFPYGQMGYGLGDLFRTAVMLIVKSGAKALGNMAVKTGANLLGDVASGKNLKAAIKTVERMQQTSQRIKP